MELPLSEEELLVAGSEGESLMSSSPEGLLKKMLSLLERMLLVLLLVIWVVPVVVPLPQL